MGSEQTIRLWDYGACWGPGAQGAVPRAGGRGGAGRQTGGTVQELPAQGAEGRRSRHQGHHWKLRLGAGPDPSAGSHPSPPIPWKSPLRAPDSEKVARAASPQLSHLCSRPLVARWLGRKAPDPASAPLSESSGPPPWPELAPTGRAAGKAEALEKRAPHGPHLQALRPPQGLGRSQGASAGPRPPGHSQDCPARCRRRPQLRGQGPAVPADKRAALFPHDKGTCVPGGGDKQREGARADPGGAVNTTPWGPPRPEQSQGGEGSTGPEKPPSLPQKGADGLPAGPKDRAVSTHTREGF